MNEDSIIHDLVILKSVLTLLTEVLTLFHYNDVIHKEN